MANLLSSQTSDTTGTGSSHSAPCTVYLKGTFGGATCEIQVSDADSNYANVSIDGVNKQAVFRGPGQISLNNLGTYYVRAVLSGSTSTTSVSVVTVTA